MSKYQPLTHHLATRADVRVAMTFAEVERVLGFPLPASARRHRAWWANNPANHVNAQAWDAAGYQSAEVNLADERLVFVKRGQATAEPGSDPDHQVAPVQHPMFGAMKGQIVIHPDTDLTAPADPDWGSRESEDLSVYDLAAPHG